MAVVALAMATAKVMEEAGRAPAVQATGVQLGSRIGSFAHVEPILSLGLYLETEAEFMEGEFNIPGLVCSVSLLLGPSLDSFFVQVLFRS